MVFLNCAGRFIKYILFFFNFLCVIAGAVLIVHGGLSLAKITEIRSILPNEHLSDAIPAVVIFIGVFILVISLFGCCGAAQSNVCLLDTYSICLLLLVLLQVILACFIFLFIDDIHKDTARTFSKMWRSRANSNESRMMLDLIQENMECCGSKNLFDYSFDMIPKSCCKPNINHCNQEAAFKIGCKSHLQDSIKSSAKTISNVCIGTAVFELMGAIMGFILSGYIRKVQAIRRCCY